MPAARRFPPDVVDALHRAKILGVRAGGAPHKFTGVWVVVAEGRVFIRSWTRKPRSWWRTFLEEPRGTIQMLDGRELAVRAVQTRSERLKDAVSAAYREKYHTPASRKYVTGFARTARRDTTTELVPA